jgi:hypothetical protein
VKSENEEFCKLKFDDFIRASSKNYSIVWEDVAQKDEPPDYFLYLDGNKYAVEATILVEKAEVGNLQLPSIEITASLWQITDDVEASAKNITCLNGAYIVSFSQPIANLKSVRDELFSKLLAYVKETQYLSTAPERIVFEHGSQICRIKKLHDEKDYIGQIGPSGSKWEGEAQNEVCKLLTERINSKNHKLSKIKEPKILLLYDAYHFANVAMYKNCIPNIPELASFHTVFVVQVNSVGFLLCSLNTSWL